MAVRQTLITPEEVKELARIDRHVQPCDLNDIRQVEATAATECLGEDFYNALVDDLINYSGVAKWTNTTTLTDGVREYKGVYYIALRDTSAEPSLKSDWEKAPKFGTDCFNDLWCERLGRYLALLVVQSSLPPISTPITASGTVKKKGEGFSAAEERSVLRLQEWLGSQVLGAFQNLHNYLTNNAGAVNDDGDKCFSLYKGLSTTCNNGCAMSGEVDLTNAEFLPNGGLLLWEGARACCGNNTCDCPECTQKHKTQTNRYVIA